MNKEWLCRQPTEKVFLSNAVLQWMKGKVQLDTTILLIQAFTMGPLVAVAVPEMITIYKQDGYVLCTSEMFMFILWDEVHELLCP